MKKMILKFVAQEEVKSSFNENSAVDKLKL
jgi:hypothetical protein